MQFLNKYGLVNWKPQNFMWHRLPCYADGNWTKGLAKEMTKKSTSVTSLRQL